jgi:hypothetical protein
VTLESGIGDESILIKEVPVDNKVTQWYPPSKKKTSVFLSSLLLIIFLTKNNNSASFELK